MSEQNVEIRVFREADRIGVVRLWELVFADDPPWNEPNLVIERKLTVQPELFFVAIADGAVVGTVLAGFDGCRGWVHHLAVDLERRRSGIATQLMQAAADGLREAGCPKLNLQVRAGNQTAVRFYQSLGLVVEDRVSMSQHLERGWPSPR